MITRRRFIQNSTSLVALFSLQPNALAQAKDDGKSRPKPFSAHPDLDAWLRLNADGTVELFAGKVEFGQGILTAFSQLLADNLGVALSRIQSVATDTQRCPNLGYTFGSRSIEQGGSAIAWAAADLRERFIRAAAQRLDQPGNTLSVRDGTIIHSGKATDLDYWQMLDAIDTRTPVSTTPPSSPPAALIGRSVPRTDIRDKAFSQPVFIQDVRLENMLHARIVAPPRPGARLATLDARSVDLAGDTQLVRNGSFLALVGPREEEVIAASATVAAACTWQGGNTLPQADALEAWLKAAAEPVESLAGETLTTALDPATVTTRITRDFQSHGSLAPSMALAKYDKRANSLRVWSHAQGMFPLRGAIARVVGLDANRVRLTHVQGCGGYGHNGADDAACDAALIAMAVPNQNIRLQYSRADEFLREPAGSAMHVEVAAKLGKDGRISHWRTALWTGVHSTRPGGPAKAGNLLGAQLIDPPLTPARPTPIPQPRGGGSRNVLPLYDLDTLHVQRHLVRDMPLRVSSLRCLGAYVNVMAIEATMDALCSGAQADPIEFRLRHLNDPRARNVLTTLREKCNWSERPTAPGWGSGIGIAQYKNSAAYCAVFCVVKADPGQKKIIIQSATSVTDAGRVVNPDGLRNQVEGGMIQAFSWTTKEALRYDETRIRSRHWGDYRVIRFDDVPQLHTHLIDRPDLPSLGVGEASPGPAGAALINAIAQATGTPVTRIPIA